MTALYSKAELAKQTQPELLVLALQHSLEFETEKPKKADILDALLELTEDDALVETDDEELDVEEEEEVEEEADAEELDDEELDDPAKDEEVDEVETKPAAKTTKAAASKKTTKAKAEPKSGDTLAAKQVASLLGTEAKTLRQFFRSPASTVEPVGSGGRYEFLETDLDKIKDEFTKWQAAHAARGSKRGPKGSSTPAEVEEIEEVESIEELEEVEEVELDDEELELEE